MTIIFVHGITIRDDGFDQLLAKVKQKIQENIPQGQPQPIVEGFYWGI